MTEQMKKNHPYFYKVLDELMFSNYGDCELKDGIYFLEKSGVEVDIRPRAIYLNFTPQSYKKRKVLMGNAILRNELMRFGFKITSNTGKVYSYPDLRDYIKEENEYDTILRASYYFACVTQVITFFSNRLGDMTFKGRKKGGAVD